MMQVLVLKVDFHDEKGKKKIMKTVSQHSGIVSIGMDSKEMKLTVTGDIDAVGLVSKLRKVCSADIVSVGPPKAPEKKKEEPPKAVVEAKKDPQEEYAKQLQAFFEAQHKSLYQPTFPYHYYYRSVEENPNACVIC